MIVLVMMAALLTTFAYSTRVIGRSGDDLNIHTLAANWFEILEAQPPEIISYDFDQAALRVAETMDPNQTGSNAEHVIIGYQVSAQRTPYTDGVATVSITIATDGGAGKPLTLQKTVNTISNATVSYDYTGGR